MVAVLSHGDSRQTAATNGSAGTPLRSVGGKGSLWHQLLSEARSGNATDKSKAYVIVLGSYDTGKSSLLRQLQIYGSVKALSPIEIHKNTGGVSLLDFAYIGERQLSDPDDIHTVDAQGFIEVYILQNPDMADKLAERLPAKAVSALCFLICLDVKAAWCAMEGLQKWKHVAERITNRLLSQRDVSEQEKLKERMQSYLHTYPRTVNNARMARRAASKLEMQHPSNAINSSIISEETPAKAESVGAGALELIASHSREDAEAEGVDTSAALAVPVVVCLTRSDYFEAMSARYEHSGEVDVMLAYLRSGCLDFCAALIACNCKDEKNPKNVLLLYRYILHRLYNYPLKEAPVLDDPEVFFMPSGCDNANLIKEAIGRTIAEDFEKPYEAWITRSTESTKVVDASHAVVVPQSTQSFLKHLQMQYPDAVIAGELHAQRKGHGVADLAGDDGLSHLMNTRWEVQTGTDLASHPAIMVQQTTSKTLQDFQRSTSRPVSSTPQVTAGGRVSARDVLLSSRSGNSRRSEEATNSRKSLHSTVAAGTTEGVSPAVDHMRTARSGLVLDGSRALSLPRKPSIDGRSSDNTLSAAVAGDSGESASLQHFFQGLLAKSKAKAPATPRERARAKPKTTGATGVKEEERK